MIADREWTYLGDDTSVRLTRYEGWIELKAGWGNGSTNSIILTPASLRALLLYLEGKNMPQSEDGKWLGLRLWMKELLNSENKG